MKRYQIKQGDYFISNDILREMKVSYEQRRKEKPELSFKKTTGESIQSLADSLMLAVDSIYPKEYSEYRRLYAQLTGLDKIAILNAHGNVRGFTWIYQDGKDKRPVQNWLNKWDGKYNSMVLFSCYIPHLVNIATKKSLLFIPDRKIATIDVYDSYENPIVDEVSYTLFDPRTGEVSPYEIDISLKEMRDEVDRRKK